VKQTLQKEFATFMPDLKIYWGLVPNLAKVERSVAFLDISRVQEAGGP
jgi:hypothetical protein